MLFDEQWEGSYNRVSTAIQKSDFSLFVQFVRERASLNSSDNRGWQPIHEAVITNLGPEFLMVLLRYESVQVDARTYEGETALLLACKYAKKENVALSCAQILIKCGANVNLPDNENETPLMFAVKNDMMSVVHLLLCQPTIEIDYSDLGGWSPLHEACVLNRVQVVQMLLDRGANVLNKDECGMTCIFSCAHSGNLETLKLLCDFVRSQGHVEYLDYGPSDLTTPLMIAAQRGFTNCVRLLHESGANIDAMASDKVTALHLATQMGNFETVEYLLSNMNFKKLPTFYSNRKSLNRALQNPLHYCVVINNIPILRLYLQKGTFHIDSLSLVEDALSPTFGFCSWLKITTLGLASSLGHVDFMRILLEAGANVNSSHNDIYPPLFAELLLQFGANPNKRMRSLNGILVTDMFVSIFYHNLFCLLLRYGLDPELIFSEANFYAFSTFVENHAFFLKDSHKKSVISVFSIVNRNPQCFNFFHAFASILRNRMGDEKIGIEINNILTNPNSLRELCRFTIRKKVITTSGTGTVFRLNINKLTLPVCTKKYLLFDDA